MACDKKMYHKELVLVKEMDGILLAIIWLPGLTYKSRNSSRITLFGDHIGEGNVCELCD